MTLGEMLERSAKRYPDKTVVMFEDRQVTYKDLNAEANRLAKALNELKIAKNSHVGILMPNCPEFFVSVFGTVKAGAVFVPLHTSFTREELMHVIERSDLEAIITAPPYDELLEILQPQIPMVANFLTFNDVAEARKFLSIPSLITSLSDSNVSPAVKPDDLAAFYFTAGTTSLPKGAMLTHVNLLANIVSLGQAVHVKRTDVLLTPLPLSHAFAMTACMLLPVFGGMTTVVLEDVLPQPCLKAISERHVTFLLGTPAMYAALANMPHLEQYDVSSLRCGLCVETPLTQALVDTFESQFPCQIYEGYGLSECSPVVSVNSKNQRKIGSVGKPLDDQVTWKIVDSEGNEAPRKTMGQLVVSGPHIMQGYYNDEESTQQAIRDGWLYTGDMAYMDNNGFVFMTAPQQDMIIVAGKTISPKEIEDVLTQHPAIQDAGVISNADPVQGEAPKAFIVPVSGDSVDEQEILEFCQEHLAQEKVPESIHIIDFIPKSINGKIQRRILREIAAGFPEEGFDEEEKEMESTKETASSVSMSFAVEFDTLLERLVTEIPGGVAGSLSGMDGIGIASFSTNPEFPTTIADAELAAVMNASQGITDTLDAGKPKEACFVADRYGFITRQLGQYIMTLVTEADTVDWGLIPSHFEKFVPLIAKDLA